MVFSPADNAPGILNHVAVNERFCFRDVNIIILSRLSEQRSDQLEPMTDGPKHVRGAAGGW